MKQAHVAVIPTLNLWLYELRHEHASLQNRFVDTAVSQLKLWNAAGGDVLFGTDVGYTPEQVSAKYQRTHTFSGHLATDCELYDRP